MNEQEYLAESAKLCEKIGKWPEFSPSIFEHHWRVWLAEHGWVGHCGTGECYYDMQIAAVKAVLDESIEPRGTEV